jgi:hypothetical protein
MRESLKKVLMKRDGITSQEADELIAEAQEELDARLEDGDIEGAEAICEEFFGLEPDYLDDLMF